MTVGNQLRAMLVKNARLHMRMPVGSFCECCLPIFFIVLSTAYVFLFTKLLPLDTSTFIVNFPTVGVPPVQDTRAYLPCVFHRDPPCLFGFAPDDARTRGIAKSVRSRLFPFDPDLNDTSGPPPQFFQDEATLRASFASDPSLLFAGIVFSSPTNYTLLLNATSMPAETKPASPIMPSFASLSNSSIFAEDGFLSIQLAVEHALIDESLGKANASAHVSVNASTKLLPARQVPVVSVNNILALLVSNMQLLSWLPFLIVSIVHLNSEKTARVREYLHMLGLTKFVYWASWSITFLIPAGFVVVIGVSVNFAFGCFSGGTLSALMILAYYSLFMVSNIAFAFVAQSLVSSSVMSIVLAIAWIYLPAQVFPLLPANETIYMVLCLIAPFNFALGVFKAAAGAKPSLMPLISDAIGWPSLFGLMALDTVLYCIFAWYLAEVSPGEFGVARPLYFPFTRDYWLPRRRDIKPVSPKTEGHVDMTDATMFERLQSPAGNGIEVAGLGKTFRSTGNPAVNAVSNLSASFGRGFITSILGQNGAGKTTTISMLVGLIPPTSGDAIIEGKSILNDMPEIRQSIGICPQRDILFPTLTAPEHLELVGHLRGMPSRGMAEAIRVHLEEIGLPPSEHGNKQVKAFSGGMKRKLSLAMALFGSPKTVFLDEPTSGIDAVSKRSIWAALERAKAGKTIVLTTHSMEESDFLSDEIFIMTSGKLRCSGSPQFLKQKFGCGYYLNVEKHQAAPVDDSALVALVKKFVPEASIVRESKNGLSLRIPFGFNAVFPGLFRELEAQSKLLGVASFGLSLTTLEDVFVRMSVDEGSSAPATGKLVGAGSDGAGTSSSPAPAAPIQAADEERIQLMPETDESTSNWKRQASALAGIKAKFFWRKWLRTLAITVVPALLLLLFLLPNKMMGVTIPRALDVPVHYDLVGKVAMQIPFVVTDPASVVRADLDKLLDAIGNRSRFMEFATMLQLLNVTATKGNFDAGIAFESLSLAHHKLGVVLLYNQSVVPSPVAIHNLVSTAFLRTVEGGALNLSTWSRAVSSEKGQRFHFDAPGLYLIMAAIVGLLVSGAVVAQRLVAERECMFKAQMHVAGLSPATYVFTSYWISVVALVPAVLLMFACIAAFRVTGTTGSMFAAVSGTFVLFIASLASFNMVVSNIFSKSDSCIKWIVILELVVAIIPYAVKMLLQMFSTTSPSSADLIQKASRSITFGSSIFPMCAFASSLVEITMGTAKTLPEVYSLSRDLTVCSGMLAVDAVLYLIIALLVEWKRNRVPPVPTEKWFPKLNEDEDVAAERSRVETGRANNDAIVLRRLRKEFGRVVAVADLSMGIRATECFGLLGVNGSGKTTTLSMVTGELAPNNGSSTVNKFLLTGSKPAFFRGARVGRCLQADSMLDYLTPREHLTALSMIRTARSKVQIAADVNQAIETLGLRAFADREVSTLSGGTTRKLSVALALLPGTRIVVLDEPSTGLDPLTRRSLWSTIHAERTKANKTVLLTTHSMEEAEAVCTTVGIILYGALTCHGTVQHLKSRFSGGYHFSVELSNGAPAEECDKLVATLLLPPEAPPASSESAAPAPAIVKVIEVIGNRRTYDIGKQPSLGALFGKIEAGKKAAGIENYTLNQASLEEIFLAQVRAVEGADARK